MAKKVLGRGLGAYFPEHEGDEQQQGEQSGKLATQRVNVTLHIPVGNIRPNPQQPRQDFDELSLQELADSIRRHGLIQPVTVRHLAGERYELISGERRLRATKMAGLNEIPAYVREVDDDDIVAFALVENVQREQLNPIEVALGYERLIEECGLSQDDVARKLGKNRTTVTNTLRLLNLPAAIQSALKSGKISTGHARALINVENPDLQEKILNEAIENDYSVRQIEEAVRKAANRNQKKKQKQAGLEEKSQDDIQLREITNRLRQKLGTKVEMKRKSKGGEIKIEYYSDDELERILSMLESQS